MELENVTQTLSLVEDSVVAEAARVSDRAMADFLDGQGKPRGTVVSAPAGAGKTELASSAAMRARARHLRVAVAAPTNEQAFGLTRRIAATYLHTNPDEKVTFVPARNVELPEEVRVLPNVVEKKA